MKYAKEFDPGKLIPTSIAIGINDRDWILRLGKGSFTHGIRIIIDAVREDAIKELQQLDKTKKAKAS